MLSAKHLLSHFGGGLDLEKIRFGVRAGIAALCFFQNEITQAVFWVFFFYFMYIIN